VTIRGKAHKIVEIWYRVPRPDDEQHAPPVVVVQKEQET
jgi:hypothetical protein